jgi:23S rRNA-/tRNA-specific pseudouridylate synthase
LKVLRGATLLVLNPRTGRTHQIRIQLARIGHPLIGEKKYLGKGTVGAPFARHALHSAAIELLHPVTHSLVKYSAPMPGDMKELLNKLSS